MYLCHLEVAGLEESVLGIPQETAEKKRAREVRGRTTKRVGNPYETGLLSKIGNCQTVIRLGVGE